MIGYDLTAQTITIYPEDPAKYFRSRDTTRSVPYYIDGRCWVINGDTIHREDSVFTAKLNSQLDTIYFREYFKRPFFPILTYFPDSAELDFTYNHCCNGFNVHEHNNPNMSVMSLSALLLNADSTKSYMIVLGEGGSLYGEFDTLAPVCRSAMSPNTYFVQVHEVEADTVNGLGELFCYVQGDSISFDTNFKLIETLCGFYFLPLETRNYLLTLDLVSKEFRIE